MQVTELLQDSPFANLSGELNRYRASTASGLDRPNVLASTSRYQIPAWVFTDGKVTVRASSPVIIRLLQLEDVVLAEHEGLDIYATGGSAEQAVEDFSRLVVDFYRFYSEQPDENLMGQAIRLKKLFGKFTEED